MSEDCYMSVKDKEIKKEWHMLANRSLTALGMKFFMGDKIDGYTFMMFTKCDDGDVLYSTSFCASKDEELTMICKRLAELYLNKHPRDSDFPNDAIVLDNDFVMDIVEKIERELNNGFDDREE